MYYVLVFCTNLIFTTLLFENNIRSKWCILTKLGMFKILLTYVFSPFSLLPGCIHRIKQGEGPCDSYSTANKNIAPYSPEYSCSRARKKKNNISASWGVSTSSSTTSSCGMQSVSKENKVFQKQLPDLSCHLGELQPNANTSVIFQDSFNTVTGIRYLKFYFLWNISFCCKTISHLASKSHFRMTNCEIGLKH